MTTNIADRPLSLANHLRVTAKRIDDGSFEYRWNHNALCNCGLLAREIIGVSKKEMCELIDAKTPHANGAGQWYKLADTYCPTTGIPSNTVFKALVKAGLVFDDFRHLEALSDPQIKAIATRDWSWTETTTTKRFLLPPKKTTVPYEFKFDRKEAASAYMNAWASLIEEFHAPIAERAESAMEQVELRPLVK